MAKTASAGMVELPSGESFVANALPDPFDARDLLYRPRLEPLAPAVDQRDITGPYGRYVLRQKGNSCVGHAVAAVVNVVLAGAVRHARARPSAGPRPLVPDAEPVSPYMLYRLARRYDEFPGEQDQGSSLRGALKGWYHHGVALEWDWPDLEMADEPDLEDPDFMEICRERPLGAFYRVNPYRLDDMQSAISELHAVCVSGRIHSGWLRPLPLGRQGKVAHVISRAVNAFTLGGHAFALVGYNDIGFLVQNSWGTEWGKDGFATLPYEDWLDSAYDAWVVRPGVPQTPFTSGRQRSAQGTGGVLATGSGPDLRRLERHVVNVAEGGQLSDRGAFISTPAQVERLFEHMEAMHNRWTEADPALERRVVLYAHGGLIGESAGLLIAQKHLNWWLNNRVYPLYFAWESGRSATLLAQLAALTRADTPEGGVGFDLVEQFDRRVERTAGSALRWMWEEMKENARAASAPIPPGTRLAWPPRSSRDRETMAEHPGASLTVKRLRRYLDACRPEPVRVHLVGHSAGAFFLAALLERLAGARIPVDTLSLLAPALRLDEFAARVLPHLRAGRVGRLTVFGLNDPRELDDVCEVEGRAVYQKSLLYLVSRALERPERPGGGEARLLGMQRSLGHPLSSRSSGTLAEALAGVGAEWIVSPSSAAADARSDSTSHEGFDDDAPTMTSVLLRILGRARPEEHNEYVPHMALREVPGLERDGRPGPAPRPRRAPVLVSAETNPPGQEPVLVTGEPQRERPVVRVADFPAPEVAVAPRTGSPVLDVLLCRGWRLLEHPELVGEGGGADQP